MEDENCGVRKFYEGLPVTNASFIIPIFYLVATMFSVGSFWYTAIMIFGYLAVSVAFVLKFKLPKLGVKDIFKVIFIALAIIVALFIVNVWVIN